MKAKFFLLISCLFLFHLTGFSQSNKLKLRLERAVLIEFQNDDFGLEELKLNQGQLPNGIKLGNDKVYKVLVEGQHKGYAYLGEAPSKERNFDFVVMFDNEKMAIRKSKVLIYRETFGREIGSQRWLAQFEGKTPSSAPAKFGENIDAISGATISARSMTNAVNKVLKNMGALQKANLL